ncbi:23S rRNA (pseudouridine(1915)-N(3))-methyltransferase RlmH [Tropicibacter naphthalenivorans]|uniref:Ribosomal RNA large subunit methyltransferase H n=1 Tax=Tropicibacter naphthalenivorans TaxID=441103 RepID=A0A0P1GAT1_9RHOB|nr:23S rRNA (pseudouridine(1915)-N(3))-methyltransferase RlmH [Tropicibacter naphthalenivorans]CUH78496.1 Ribosomal RNA large subunit methyltransferase H [Tropicibacter naphthalenivorans]SMC80773.1 23S rRNA (pseudouridine1915-N3)-methyltransferase [Tropicibacter naphthalenivorans]
MRVHLCVVGRLRKGPERELVDDYLKRFDKTGRAHGLGPVSVLEVEDKKGGGMAAEAALLRKALPTGAVLCCLDERGAVVTSPEFSERMARWRDTGCQDLALVIGGADGIDPSLRAEADFLLSFGKMVWPHMLVRVMVAEQLYRAASILAGTPYHRA